jgi:hypothetical protein
VTRVVCTDQQLGLLLANLSAITTDVERGCVVVVEFERLHVRSLPIGGAAEGAPPEWGPIRSRTP